MIQRIPAAGPLTADPTATDPTASDRTAADPTAADPAVQQFRDDVLWGLSQYPKQLPPKYFYDQRGSELFDAICDLDEYYVTRTELAIMRHRAAEMAACLPQQGVLIEFGSGSSVKTRLLLDHLPALQAYVPVDISGDHLRAAAGRLRRRYRELEILPVVADFTGPIRLASLPSGAARTVYFPGSTIGNFEHDDARLLLQRIAHLARPGGHLLIGFDLQKDPAVIEAAYNDRRGVTAEFNRNLLHRINRELDADFQLQNFVHQAHYDRQAGRIEMRLRCTRAQNVQVAGRCFRIEQGETIRTEYSHKYTVDQFAALASDAGLVMRHQWVDDRGYFAVLLLDVDDRPIPSILPF